VQLTCERRMRATPGEVLALLREPLRWPGWVPGVVAVEPDDDDDPSVLAVRLHAAVPWELVVETTHDDAGLAVALVRGPAPDLAIELRVHGAVATIELRLTPPAAVPGPLVRELEQVALPEALARLDELAARATSP